MCVCRRGTSPQNITGGGEIRKTKKKKRESRGIVCVCCVSLLEVAAEGNPSGVFSLHCSERRDRQAERGVVDLSILTHNLFGVCVCVCPGCGGRKANHRDGRKRKGGGNCFGRRDGHSQIIYTASIWFHRQPSFSLSIDFTPVGPAFRMIYANLCCCPLQIPGLQITEMRCSITSPSAGSDTELIVMKALVLLRPY